MIKRHKILWYYVFTLICAVILGGTASGMLKASIPEQAALSLAMVQLSPTCGLVLLCLLCRDWQPFRQMSWRPVQNRKSVLWLLLALLLPVAITAAATAVLSLMGNRFVKSGYSGAQMAMLVLASVIGCVGEETGWRGFLLPAFREKHPMFLSAVFTGLMWGAWHFGKLSLYGIVGYLLFIVMITEFSVIMAWIYHKSGGNLPAMVLFHLGINVTAVLLLTKREGIPFYLAGCAIGAAVCLILLICEKNDFFKATPAVAPKG